MPARKTSIFGHGQPSFEIFNISEYEKSGLEGPLFCWPDDRLKGLNALKVDGSATNLIIVIARRVEPATATKFLGTFGAFLKGITFLAPFFGLQQGALGGGGQVVEGAAGLGGLFGGNLRRLFDLYRLPKLDDIVILLSLGFLILFWRGI